MKSASNGTTVWRGKLAGPAIGASIFVAACEQVRVQPDLLGLRLRGFSLSGVPRGADDWPDVAYELALEPMV